MKFIIGIDWYHSFFKFTTYKKIILSLKIQDFQKQNLFNKLNPRSMKILSDHTFLYIVHAFGNSITLVFINHVPTKKTLKNKRFKKYQLLNK